MAQYGGIDLPPNLRGEIDPDQMTYEQLLELEEAIGYVPTGCSAETIQSFPTTVLDADGEQCTICQLDMVAGETVKTLIKCGHAYHVECIDGWLE
jgi:hypothetical protein